MPLPDFAPSLILVRHCSATGQEPEAELTPEGQAQSLALSDFLSALLPARIISSPFVRAIESIKPLATRLCLNIQEDQRLEERCLGTVQNGDWRTALRLSFDDFNLCLPDGESSATATERGRAAIDDILAEARLPAVVVSHGNLLSLIAKSFKPELGYEFWQNLRNPEVIFVTERDGAIELEKVFWGELPHDH